ncbi:hypothetical protein Scep_012154 [Stephania cephalantha]|uniref:FBD domain-containing protein n=1 Tax=Stephania cephalantha TaxID=152367 RepID=A0AAP0P9L4_9MAGN
MGTRCNQRKSEIKAIAPNLRTFRCGNCGTRKFSFKDLHHLDHACFTFETKYFQDDGYVHRATSFVEALCPYIQSLTLKKSAVEAVFGSPTVLENASLQFRNLKYLELTACLSRNCVMAIMHLLKLSPNIKTLNLVISEEASNWTNMANYGNLWISKECLLQHRRFVKILGVMGSDNEIMHLELLLKNSVVLEEVIVSSGDKFLPRMLVDFFKKVMAIPRASSQRFPIRFSYPPSTISEYYRSFLN